MVEEVVKHSITTSFSGIDIHLGFESCTEMTHHQGHRPRSVGACSALVSEVTERQNAESLIESLFLSLDAGTKASRRIANVYPTDSGELVGTSSHTLTSVNGLPVEGPTFSDTYYEQEWENLNDQYIQRWDEDDENSESAFCWLHSLTQERSSTISRRSIPPGCRRPS